MAECLRMGKFAEDWKKTTVTEDYFCGSYGFENKTTKQYQEFSTAYSGVPLVMKAPLQNGHSETDSNGVLYTKD